MATKAELIAEIAQLKAERDSANAERAYWVNEAYRLRAIYNRVVRAINED